MLILQATSQTQKSVGLQISHDSFVGQALISNVNTFSIKGTGTSVDQSTKFEVNGSVKLNNAKFNLTGEGDMGEKQNVYKIKAGSGQTFPLGTIASDVTKLNLVALQQLEGKFSPKPPTFQAKFGAGLEGGFKLAGSDFKATVTFTKPIILKGVQPNEFLSNAETATSVKVSLGFVDLSGQAKFVGIGSTQPIYTEYKIGLTVPIKI